MKLLLLPRWLYGRTLLIRIQAITASPQLESQYATYRRDGALQRRETMLVFLQQTSLYGGPLDGGS